MGKAASNSWEPDGWAFWFWLFLFVMWGLLSCSRTQYIPVESVRIDSISIKDTVFQERLVPYRDSVAVADTASFLTNPYAYSRAVWSSGRLHHVLGIWPQATVRVQVPYYVDRYVYRSEPKIVEVEKKFTRWQRIKLEAGGYAVGAVFAGIALIIVRWMMHNGRR